MKAFTKYKYGGPEVLNLEEIDVPAIKEDQLLVQVMANSVNPADWHILRGKPLFSRLTLGLFKPKQRIPGADFSGIVIRTGSRVSRFNVGDRVFGETLLGGAFAEYAAVPETACSLMPADMSFEEMASLPVAGLTAFQALVTHGKLVKGETVLINGSSGGVGHLAVQLAKAYGGIVTAVCSSKNIDFVKALGAYKVIPYDREDIHQHEVKYNLVVDVNGNLTHRDFVRMGQRGVMVGFTTMQHMFSVVLAKSLSSFPLVQFTAGANANDLAALAALVKSGQLRVNIEKVYPFEKLPAAIGQIENMRTRGKVAVTGKHLRAGYK